MRYGPRSAPLFYTALREPPGRLTWEAWPQAMAYRVTVGRFTDAEPAPLIAMTLSGETCSLSLRDLSVRPGAVYAWRVEPICPEAPAIGAEEEETCDAAGFSYEGRFWLLDADMTARWERGQALFEPMPDPDFRAIAQALMLAEVGLYHEALLHIRNGSVRQERQARTVLAHTAQALIYRQMAQRLEVEENRDVPGGRSPACFAAWVAAREEYHRKQVTGQLPCGAKTATRTSSTDGLEWTRQQIGTQTRRAA
jgi:hypothetical protein